MTCSLLSIWPFFLQPWSFIILFQPYQLSHFSPNRPRTLQPESLCTLCHHCLENICPDSSLTDFFVSFTCCSNVTIPERISWLLVYITVLSPSLCSSPSVFSSTVVSAIWPFSVSSILEAKSLVNFSSLGPGLWQYLTHSQHSWIFVGGKNGWMNVTFTWYSGWLFNQEDRVT